MDALEIQLTLLELPPFSPIPMRPHHYVPALLNWAGEREALRTASEDVWENMTPLIQVAPRGISKKTRVAVGTISAWARQLHAAVGSHPFFLDALGVPTDLATHPETGRSVLAHIFDAARHKGLVFVPVCSDRDKVTMEAVRAAAAIDHRGVAIRCRIGPSSFHLSPPTAQAALEEVLDKLGVGVREADLLLDYGYIGDDDLRAEDVIDTLDEVARVGDWRNVAVIATSVPSSFADYVSEGLIGGVPRKEWELWGSLKEHTHRRLAVGDYGAQHPRAPQPKGGGRMRANVRYPTTEGWLVGRGIGPFQDLSPQQRADQYRKICHDIVVNRLFVGRRCCPGDRAIQDCADGVLAPGAQSMWRFAGTAHDLRLAAADVARWNRATAEPVVVPMSASDVSPTRRVAERRGSGRR